MAKTILTKVKLQVPAGKATPGPPVGPALGQHGIKAPEFCQQFNAATASKSGTILPVIITIYSDKTFSFITKTSPAAALLKQAAGIAKGSGEPNKTKVAKVKRSQVLDIAKEKMKDLNATNLDAAAKIIAGTAKSMGIEVIDG